MKTKDQTSKILRSFGTQLKLLRHDKGYSQEVLAFNAELDRTYIGSVERGERNISLLNIEKLAKALGVTPAAFFETNNK